MTAKKIQKVRLLKILFGLVLAVSLMHPAWPLSQDIEAGGKIPKFQIEVWGGYAALNPSDLNLAASYENDLQELLFDKQYNWLSNRGEILSWTRSGDEARRELNRAVPFGIRLKYTIYPWLAFSLGFKYLSASESQVLFYEYTSAPFSDFINKERIQVSPYSLSAQAYAPMLGIHVFKALSRTAELEAYLSGGPLFGESRYEQDRVYEWWFNEWGEDILVFREQTNREEEGSGIGLALETGGRLNLRFYRGWGLFFEAGYALQKIGHLSGSGKETRDGQTKSWEGDWRILKDDLLTSWETLSLEYPTSYAIGGPGGNFTRDFELDLSGFQLRFGILFRF